MDVENYYGGFGEMHWSERGSLALPGLPLTDIVITNLTFMEHLLHTRQVRH